MAVSAVDLLAGCGTSPWAMGLDYSSSTLNHWHDEALLKEALTRVRDIRWDQRHAEADHSETDGEDE
jgi:hypothetical protein